MTTGQNQLAKTSSQIHLYELYKHFPKDLVQAYMLGKKYKFIMAAKFMEKHAMDEFELRREKIEKTLTPAIDKIENIGFEIAELNDKHHQNIIDAANDKKLIKKIISEHKKKERELNKKKNNAERELKNIEEEILPDIELIEHKIKFTKMLFKFIYTRGRTDGLYRISNESRLDPNFTNIATPKMGTAHDKNDTRKDEELQPGPPDGSGDIPGTDGRRTDNTESELSELINDG